MIKLHESCERKSYYGVVIDRKALNQMHMQILAKLFGFTLKYVPKLFAIFYELFITLLMRLFVSVRHSPAVRTMKSKYQTLLPHIHVDSMLHGIWLRYSTSH